MKLYTLLAFGFLGWAGMAAAQDQNPNSPAYHALHNPQSPNYVGPRQQPVAQPQTPQPTGYWEKTWGAIAADGLKGILGTSVGVASQNEAESNALAECRSKGGGKCEVFAYHNQCAALIAGDTHNVLLSAGNIESASKVGLNRCQKKDTGCRVYYSACTEPIFHRY